MKYNKTLVNGAEIIRECTYNSVCHDLTGKYALHVVLTGEVNFTIEKRNITLVPGSFIFINPGSCYTKEIASEEEVYMLSVLFEPVFIQGFECSSLFKEYLSPEYSVSFYHRETPLLEFICPLLGDMKFNVMQLIKQLETENTDPLVLEEYLNHALLDYYELYETEVIKREASLPFLNGNTKTEIMRRLSVARDYMISNYKERIQLDKIAQISCLSVNHLLRTFKQAYQLSPHQFLTKVRLHQAKYLLRNTDFPVSEIVDIVGFECPSSFIRLFRNSFNVTPGQYR